MNTDYTSTLFVGIDVSLKTNVVCAIDFQGNVLFAFSANNSLPGAESILAELLDHLHKHHLTSLVIALESTSIYGVHIANFLSSNELLLFYHPLVYCLNPKMTSNYRKSFVDMDKTDPDDAYVIADFIRTRQTALTPWKGSAFLALQRLTRHRLHLVELLTREKTYMISNLYLKFSEMAALKKGERPFSNTFGATSAAIITEFLSLDDIIYTPLEELVAFINEKGHHRFVNSQSTALLLKKAARDSYRLDQTLYEPINASIASSFNVIQALNKEVKTIDKAITKAIQGLHSNGSQVLRSIPGIGPVCSGGILAEIGAIGAFHSDDALAKYAGLTWRKKQSGSYQADVTRMTKTGNKYLRYYLIEAANSVRHHIPEYEIYYKKKHAETSTHQHKRALALTSRKLVRLIFSLLSKDQLYSGDHAGSTASK